RADDRAPPHDFHPQNADADGLAKRPACDNFSDQELGKPALDKASPQDSDPPIWWHFQEAGRLQCVLRLEEDMRSHGLAPGPAAAQAALRAAVAAQSPEKTARLLEELRGSDVQLPRSEAATWRKAGALLLKAGQLDALEAELRSMHAAGIDTGSMANDLIEGLCQKGEVERANAVAEHLADSATAAPSPAACVALLTALSAEGRWERVEELLDALPDMAAVLPGTLRELLAVAMLREGRPPVRVELLLEGDFPKGALGTLRGLAAAAYSAAGEPEEGRRLLRGSVWADGEGAAGGLADDQPTLSAMLCDVCSASVVPGVVSTPLAQAAAILQLLRLIVSLAAELPGGAALNGAACVAVVEALERGVGGAGARAPLQQDGELVDKQAQELLVEAVELGLAASASAVEEYGGVPEALIRNGWSDAAIGVLQAMAGKVGRGGAGVAAVEAMAGRGSLGEQAPARAVLEGFRTMLSALEGDGRWQEAAKTIERLREEAVAVGPEAARLVEAMCRAGELEMAERVWAGLVVAGELCPLSASAVVALTDAATAHGHIAFATEVLATTCDSAPGALSAEVCAKVAVAASVTREWGEAVAALATLRRACVLRGGRGEPKASHLAVLEAASHAAEWGVVDQVLGELLQATPDGSVAWAEEVRFEAAERMCGVREWTRAVAALAALPSPAEPARATVARRCGALAARVAQGGASEHAVEVVRMMSHKGIPLGKFAGEVRPEDLRQMLTALLTVSATELQVQAEAAEVVDAMEGAVGGGVDGLTGGKLVIALAQAGELHAAERWWGRLEAAGVVADAGGEAWRSLMDAAALAGDLEMCAMLARRGSQLDASTSVEGTVSTLRTMCAGGLWGEALQIAGGSSAAHCAIISEAARAGLWEHVEAAAVAMATVSDGGGFAPKKLFGALLGLAAAGEWVRAENVIDSAAGASRGGGEVYKVAAEVVCGLGEAGRWVLAERELREAQLGGDIPTYSSLIGSLARAGRWRCARRMMFRAREAGAAPDAASLAAVGFALARGGQPPLEAEDEAEALDELGTAPEWRGSQEAADQDAGFAQVAAKVVRGLWRDGERILQEGAESQGGALTARAAGGLAALLQALAGAGRWEEVVTTIEGLSSAGREGHGAALNAAMQATHLEALARAGRWEAAVAALPAAIAAAVQGDGVPEDDEGDGEAAGEAWAVVVTARSVRLLLRIAAAEGGGGAEMVEHAAGLMREKRVAVGERDVANMQAHATWATGHSEEAAARLEALQMEGGMGGAPHGSTYGAAVTAFARLQQWDRLMAILDQAEQARAWPGAAALNELAKAAAHSGEWERLTEVQAKMAGWGAAPDGAAYEALVGAAAGAGEVERARQLLELAERDPIAALGPAPYDAVARLLGARGEWRDAQQVAARVAWGFRGGDPCPQGGVAITAEDVAQVAELRSHIERGLEAAELRAAREREEAEQLERIAREKEQQRLVAEQREREKREEQARAEERRLAEMEAWEARKKAMKEKAEKARLAELERLRQEEVEKEQAKKERERIIQEKARARREKEAREKAEQEALAQQLAAQKRREEEQAAAEREKALREKEQRRRAAKVAAQEQQQAAEQQNAERERQELAERQRRLEERQRRAHEREERRAQRTQREKQNKTQEAATEHEAKLEKLRMQELEFKRIHEEQVQRQEDLMEKIRLRRLPKAPANKDDSIKKQWQGLKRKHTSAPTSFRKSSALANSTAHETSDDAHEIKLPDLHPRVPEKNESEESLARQRPTTADLLSEPQDKKTNRFLQRMERDYHSAEDFLARKNELLMKSYGAKTRY
ncbi:hypothetical protein CYMTET_31909, partial [Cymbomonas tetramitiformis]